MWEKQKAIDFINKSREEITEMVTTRTVPQIAYQPGFWFCQGCEHAEDCQRDTPGGVNSFGASGPKEAKPMLELVKKGKKQTPLV